MPKGERTRNLLTWSNDGSVMRSCHEAEADLFGLMGQLIERMRRSLARQHLEKDEQFGLVIKDSLVRGRIDFDSNEDGRVPLLVIDGQEVSWEKFGRMVMGFEGWQFKFEIRDRSEEV
jgi:hypothetical protein